MALQVLATSLFLLVAFVTWASPRIGGYIPRRPKHDNTGETTSFVSSDYDIETSGASDDTRSDIECAAGVDLIVLVPDEGCDTECRGSDIEWRGNVTGAADHRCHQSQQGLRITGFRRCHQSQPDLHVTGFRRQVRAGSANCLSLKNGWNSTQAS